MLISSNNPFLCILSGSHVNTLWHGNLHVEVYKWNVLKNDIWKVVRKLALDTKCTVMPLCQRPQIILQKVATARDWCKDSNLYTFLPHIELTKKRGYKFGWGLSLWQRSIPLNGLSSELLVATTPWSWVNGCLSTERWISVSHHSIHCTFPSSTRLGYLCLLHRTLKLFVIAGLFDLIVSFQDHSWHLHWTLVLINIAQIKQWTNKVIL